MDAKATSITCPVCNHSNKMNRISKNVCMCRRCGFAFNAQYVACLNIFSYLDDGTVAISGGRIVIAPHKAGLVVPIDVAPDVPPNKMRWLREKPVPIDIMHGQPLFLGVFNN